MRRWAHRHRKASTSSWSAHHGAMSSLPPFPPILSASPHSPSSAYTSPTRWPSSLTSLPPSSHPRRSSLRFVRVDRAHCTGQGRWWSFRCCTRCPWPVYFVPTPALPLKAPYDGCVVRCVCTLCVWYVFAVLDLPLVLFRRLGCVCGVQVRVVALRRCAAPGAPGNTAGPHHRHWKEANRGVRCVFLKHAVIDVTLPVAYAQTRARSMFPGAHVTFFSPRDVTVEKFLSGRAPQVCLQVSSSALSLSYCTLGAGVHPVLFGVRVHDCCAVESQGAGHASSEPRAVPLAARRLATTVDNSAVGHALSPSPR